VIHSIRRAFVLLLFSHPSTDEDVIVSKRRNLVSAARKTAAMGFCVCILLRMRVLPGFGDVDDCLRAALPWPMMRMSGIALARETAARVVQLYGDPSAPAIASR